MEREFEQLLDKTRFTLEQVRFVDLIINELTKNGVVDPGRLFESPYTDVSLRSPDEIFGDVAFSEIVVKLDEIKRTAVPDQLST